MDDDDYWNTSETKAQALSFDDDVLSPQEILAIGKKTYPGQKEDGPFSSANITAVKTEQLPLTSLVSPKALDLNTSKNVNQEPTETTAVTLKRLILGRNCSLHVHRSMKSKTELLDGAIAVGDGNAILTIAQFQHIVKTQGNNVEGLLNKMPNLLANHFNQPGVDAHQAKMVADYIKLLEWQRYAKKSDLSAVLPSLAYTCAHHWNEGAGNIMSPLTLCQRQQIPPLQYDWVVLNVHAKANKWDIVESLFTKKSGSKTEPRRVPRTGWAARACGRTSRWRRCWGG
ncbi:hypothetical protein O3G_MSEX015382 [Manduca sexta]|uniref:Uncharacterized protein n=1 Tax=Manduca sexta TaxID=7130 RepID=A0A922A0T5_MANSE|nr:hypothetical protein O3G_MSEX015382 [Manduca sexta]